MESTEVMFSSCMIPSLANPLSESFGSVTPPKNECPWGKTPAAEAVSFSDVMSEQLATELQREEEGTTENSLNDLDLQSFKNLDTSDDFLLAQMLQLEFDKEHDKILKNEERKYNRDNKVTISFEKYRRLPNTSFSDDETKDDDAIEQHTKRHWDTIDQANKTLQAVGKHGVRRENNTTTTKHDLTAWGRKNTGKLMECPHTIKTGDGGGFDMKISNNILNTLKAYSKREQKRINRIHDKKEKATKEKALDENTRLILYKLVNGEVLDEVNGCISTGKEACVYHAFRKLEDDTLPSAECAIKIFKTTLNEFQNRDLYIRDDFRFHDRFSRQNPRKVIHMWAEKEMRNLMRINKAQIPCPEVITLKKHVLVMSFIGSNCVPAPQLKDVKFSTCNAELAYQQTIEIMKDLYNKCELVHADLSEYNLLWYDDKVWVIDVSQAVEKTHPTALEFLERDCRNICQFFKHLDVVDVMKPEALFTEICGYVQTY